LVEMSIIWMWFPFTMGCFVVAHQEEWFIAITSVEPFEAFVCDNVGGIPKRFNLFAHLDHIGIEILALTRQD